MRRLGVFVVTLAMIAVGCGDESQTPFDPSPDPSDPGSARGGGIIAVTIDGCVPLDNNGKYLDLLEVKEGNVVGFRNADSGLVTISFDPELFGVSQVTIGDGSLALLTVQSGSAGNTYDYSIGCQAARRGSPKVKVGEEP